MKKFLTKITIFFAFVLGITLLINQIYIIKYPYTSHTEESKFLRGVPDYIMLCNFGSSHGVHGYDYEELEDSFSCFNFALDSQRLSYDERILEYYQNHIAKGAVVIIDISYFACWGQAETKDDSFESKNRRYYRFLPNSLIKQYDFYTGVMIKYFPSVCDGPFEVAKVLLRPEEHNKSMYPDIVATADTIDVEANAKAACQRHIFDNKRDKNGHLIYNEEEVRALYDMVEICRKHGATPIFVTVPYMSEYTNAIMQSDSDFFPTFYDWIESVSSDLQVNYYDYSMDKRFINDYSLFYNADHMNTKGAKKFTSILYDEVIKQLI